MLVSIDAKFLEESFGNSEMKTGEGILDKEILHFNKHFLRDVNHYNADGYVEIEDTTEEIEPMREDSYEKTAPRRFH